MKVFLALFLVATSLTAMVRSQALNLALLPKAEVEFEDELDIALSEGYLTNLERNAVREVVNNLAQGITFAPEVLKTLNNDQLTVLAEVLEEVITDVNKEAGNGLPDFNFDTLVSGVVNPGPSTTKPRPALIDLKADFKPLELVPVPAVDPYIRPTGLQFSRPSVGLSAKVSRK